jgi:hypothetical protein
MQFNLNIRNVFKKCTALEQVGPNHENFQHDV